MVSTWNATLGWNGLILKLYLGEHLEVVRLHCFTTDKIHNFKAKFAIFVKIVIISHALLLLNCSNYLLYYTTNNVVNLSRTVCFKRNIQMFLLFEKRESGTQQWGKRDKSIRPSTQMEKLMFNGGKTSLQMKNWSI